MMGNGDVTAVTARVRGFFVVVGARGPRAGPLKYWVHCEGPMGGPTTKLGTGQLQ